MKFGLRLVAKAVLLLTAIAAMGALQEHRWSLGWVGAVMVVSLLTFFAVLVHELAHAATARWMGANVLKIVVLPFEFVVHSRRLRFVGRTGHGDLGGYHLDRVSAHRRHVLIAAAGPLANIVTAMAAGFLAATLDAGRQGAQLTMLTPVGSNLKSLPTTASFARCWRTNPPISVMVSPLLRRSLLRSCWCRSAWGSATSFLMTEATACRYGGI